MSFIAEINYQQLSQECDAVCENVEFRIRELEKLLVNLQNCSAGCLDSDMSGYIQSIRQRLTEWTRVSREVRSRSDDYRTLGHWSGDSDDPEYRSFHKERDRIYSLKRQVNKYVADLKPSIRAMTSSLRNDTVDRINRENASRQQSMRQGSAADDTADLIESIPDVNLRQFTHIAHISHPELNGAELMDAGRKLYEEAVSAARKQELRQELEIQREQMKRANMSEDDIRKVLSASSGDDDRQKLENLYESSSNAIISETLRKESLKTILKAIQQRGFIVDMKNIRKSGDVVTLIAQKAGGEVAKFKVFLDGRFIYDFQGYEGQACQKDIEPFMKDLEEVYGMKILDRREIWKNPDKIGSQHVQYVNHNYGGK